jgi:DNA-binding transcriptional LysR family regulator
MQIRYFKHMHLELRHLRYFLAVADSGHMTRAAQQLGIQQPPLSIQIRALEMQLGVDLFHRRPRGMALTDAGRQFVIEARRIVEDLATTQLRMTQIARGQHGTLNVGFTSSAASHAFMPEALRALRKQYPDITLELSEDNAATLTEAVVDARLHCALLRVPVSRPEGIMFRRLLSESVVVALPLDHPLADRQPGVAPALAVNDLRDESFILVRRPGAPGLYANFMALCEEHGFRPRVAREVQRMMTNLNLVAAGAGISIVPASMRDVHRHAIAYRNFEESHRLEAPLTLAWRQEDFSGATKTFVDLLTSVAQQYPSAKQVPLSANPTPRQT